MIGSLGGMDLLIALITFIIISGLIYLLVKLASDGNQE